MGLGFIIFVVAPTLRGMEYTVGNYGLNNGGLVRLAYGLTIIELLVSSTGTSPCQLSNVKPTPLLFAINKILKQGCGYSSM